jgi:excisionase family DNA binding protein
MPKRLITDPTKLSTFDVARLLNVSRVTVMKWSNEGILPEPRMVGNKRTWTDQQIKEFKQKYLVKQNKK